VRIGFDARMANHSGIGTFITNFLEHYPRRSDTTLVLFGDPAVLSRFGRETVPFAAPIYSIREQLVWPRMFAGRGLDLLHLPHYNFPVMTRCPMVIHIHDIIHLLFPEYLPNRLALIYARFFLRRAVRRARVIIVNAEATRRDLVRVLQADPARIRVVPYAVAAQFTVLSDEERRQKAYLYDKYNLPEKYCLYVGNIRPIKNIPRLLAGYRRFLSRTNSDYELVLAGRSFMPAWYLRVQAGKGIRAIGEVAADDLPALYNFATIFLFPSLYEGFGLPVLEAASCGVPVICSRCGSLEEVTAGSALYVDEQSVQSIAEGITRLVGNSRLRHEYRQRGRENARRFSWDATVRALMRVHEEVLGRGGGACG